MEKKPKSKFHDVYLTGLEFARKFGERLTLADALSNYADWLMRINQTQQAREFAEESDRLYKQIGSENNSVNSLVFAEISWVEGNTQRAKAYYMELHERNSFIGEKFFRSQCLANLGLLAMEDGDLNMAQGYLEQAIVLTREIGFKPFIAYRLAELSNLSFMKGNIKDLKQNFRESLSLKSYLTPPHKAYILVTILGSLYRQKPEISASLLGVMDTYEMEDFFPLKPVEKRYSILAMVHAREKLGDAVFTSAFAEGQKMSLDEGLDLALKTVEEM